MDDVGVIQLRRELGLVGEHRDELFVVRQMRKNLLDRDDLLEPLHPAAARTVELGHSSGRDAFQNLVLTETVGTGAGDRDSGLAGATDPGRKGRRRPARGGWFRTSRHLDAGKRVRDHLVDLEIGRKAGGRRGRRSFRCRGRRSSQAARRRTGEDPGKGIAQPLLDLLFRVVRRETSRWMRNRCRSRNRRRRGLTSDILQDIGKDVRRSQRGGPLQLGRRESQRPGGEIGRLDRRLDTRAEVLVGKRPDDEVEGSHALRVRLSVGPLVAGDHQKDRRRRGSPLPADLPNDFGGGKPRKHSREDHQVELARHERRQTFLPVVGLGDRVLIGWEQRTDALARARLVIDQENPF